MVFGISTNLLIGHFSKLEIQRELDLAGSGVHEAQRRFPPGVAESSSINVSSR
jgi:hypothetical protein